MSKSLKKRRIIITGGHLSPALSLIKELRKEGSWEIFFVGRKHPFEGDKALSFEWKVIRKIGLPFFPLVTGRVQRRFTFYTIPSILKILIGLFQSFKFIYKIKPDIILSFGGYIAFPVAFSGWLLKVPVVTHEQTLMPGLANRIIAFFARKICLSWPETLSFFPKEKTILTGNPLREEIFKYQRSNIKDQISNEDLPFIYITGGITGSHAINKAVLEILPELVKKYRIIHQCGESRVYKDYEKLKTRGLKLKAQLRKRYCLTKYVGLEDIGWVLNSADIVISRAGANITSELLALGKPAILIPFPFAAGDEQRKNAEILKRKGIGIIIEQKNLTGKSLKRKIDFMIKNLSKLKKKGEVMKKRINLDAGQKILKVVEKTLHAET